MRFLIDMNLSPLWVSYLTSQGFEAVHWSTVGQPEAADSEISGRAKSNLSWTLRTTERYGLVQLTKQGRRVNDL